MNIKSIYVIKVVHNIEFKDHKTKCIIFWFLEKLKIYRQITKAALQSCS